MTQMAYVMQMLPLLKKSIDNLLAVVGDKATSDKSFDVLKCVPLMSTAISNINIFVPLVCTAPTH